MPVNRIQQANYDRLTAMAQKGPLSQTNQRNLAYASKRLGMNNQPQMPAEMPIGNFQGDTSVPNMNTIGFPAPRGPVDTGMPKATPTGLPQVSPMATAPYQGGIAPPAGPGAGLMGGSTPPPGAAFKKGGKVKKMASGGSASSRADGIATRGKTKCKMY